MVALKQASVHFSPNPSITLWIALRALATKYNSIACGCYNADKEVTMRFVDGKMVTVCDLFSCIKFFNLNSQEPYCAPITE